MEIIRQTRKYGLPCITVTGLTLAALLIQTAPASAQTQSDIDALRAQIQALQDRLDQLEAREKADAQAAKAAPAPTVTSGTKFPLVVSGLLQVQALGNLSETTTPTNSAKQINTFRLRRAEIRLTSTLSPRLSGTVMFDPAKVLSTSAPVTTNGVNQSTTPLQEVIIKYLTTNTKSWQNFVDVGQFKIPVGYEGDLVASSDLETIDRALMYQIRDPFGGGNGDIRDTGVQLRGKAGEFAYNLGAFNGLGERQNALAAGDPKAIIGRLIFSPASCPAVKIGLSLARGDNENESQAGTTAGNQSSRRLRNVFAVYQRDKVTWQNEFLDGDLQVEGPTTPTADRPIRSYYTSLGYMFRPSFEGVFRYDYFNFDRDLPVDTTVNDLTLGINYYIKGGRIGNKAKIQADLVRRLGANGIGNGATSTTFPGSSAFIDNRTYLITQFQTAF